MTWNKRLMGAALAAFLGLGSAGFGQDSPGAQPKYFSRKPTFRIPVRIDEQERDSIRELKLFVRSPEGDWSCKERANVGQTAFSFRADHDGEYWFSVVTVDKSGKSTPADPTREDPGLIVIVDTQLPEVDVRVLNSGAGSPYLQCRMADANPDYTSVKVEYQAADGTWKPLESVPNALGVVQVPSPEVLDGRIRVHAADKAGNVVEREIDLNVAKMMDAPPTLRAPGSAVASGRPGIKLANDFNMPALGANSVPTLMPGIPSNPPAGRRPASESAPKPVVIAPFGSDSVPPLGPNSSTSEKSSYPGEPAVVVPSPMSTPMLPHPAASSPISSLESNRGEGSGCPLVNSNKCHIDFAVDFTPKGIAQVEVWTTADECKTWRMSGISVDGKSPVLVEFPADGKFGYLFRVKPQRGLCPPPPKAGDTADGWLEVDTTKPAAELLGASLDDDKETGQLVIAWTAKDANLGAQPVSIYYAVQPNGAWQPIVEKIANLGNYRWNVPNGIGSEVYIRLEVSDRAGNVSRCDTASPVQIAAPRPKVRVLNVAPVKQ